MKAKCENTAIIVPVYNSESHLVELFKRIFKYFPIENVIAIDDASADDSAEICERVGVKLIRLLENSGKGNALQIGFSAAIKKGFNFAFSIDSDLQHQPEDFPEFLKMQNEKSADLVIGKRDFSYSKMPLPRICSNTITSGIVSLFTRQKIADSQCGFRLYNLDLIKTLKFRTKRYQFETEVILKFAKAGGKIVFVPVATIYDGQRSYISHFRDIMNFVKIVFFEMTHKLEKK